MSTLNVSNITDGTTTVGTSYVVNGSAKAWLYRSSGGLIETFGVSSYVDNSTGNYSYNLTSAMISANGHISMPVCRTSDDRSASVIINSASQFTSYSRDISANALEDSNILAITHGDLA
jgi:hypothetical protein